MTARTPPPFSALRVIEAASRHRSYTWAARELEVTHSAVSQSVKRLEIQLGTKLFERRGGAMEPSAAALRLAQAYADAAGVLQRSIEDVALAVPPPSGHEDGALVVRTAFVSDAESRAGNSHK